MAMVRTFETSHNILVTFELLVPELKQKGILLRSFKICGEMTLAFSTSREAETTPVHVLGW
jgi:hypothetical protein